MKIVCINYYPEDANKVAVNNAIALARLFIQKYCFHTIHWYDSFSMVYLYIVDLKQEYITFKESK